MIMIDNWQDSHTGIIETVANLNSTGREVCNPKVELHHHEHMNFSPEEYNFSCCNRPIIIKNSWQDRVIGRQQVDINLFGSASSG